MKKEWDEKISELHKERLKIVEKDLFDKWKLKLSELDEEIRAEMSQLSNELWIESRRLAPRTICLGTDVLGNKYWIFSSRKTKERDFGGWVVIQTPNEQTPTGTPSPTTTTTVDATSPEETKYSDLKSWYYVEKAEDIHQLSKWTTYLARKSFSEYTSKKRASSTVSKGSPNKLGQSFAVEIISPSPGKMKERPGKGRKVIEFAGLVDTRLLCEELGHAADWIDERYIHPLFLFGQC